MDRVVIVTKPTGLTELIREHLTMSSAKFELESGGRSIAPFEAEHDTYVKALAEIRRQIPPEIPTAKISREQVPDFPFRDTDLVLVCGPDGLFANVAKYVGDQLLLTVNPDPKNVTGALMLFAPKSVRAAILAIQKGTHKTERLPFVKAAFADNRVVWGINDVFIGRRDHISARYEILFAGQKERQSSSGIIVSTGIGSSGWMRSVVAMMTSVAGSSGALERLPLPRSDELVFVVREPFPSPSTGTTIVTGRIRPGRPLVVACEMPEGGCVFSDGVTEKTIEWKAGSSVTISVGDRHVTRVLPN